MFKVIIDGETKEFEEPITIERMIETKNHKYVAATVDNRMRELTFVVNRDCTIKLLDLTFRSASKVYEASLRYVLAMAFENLYPHGKLEYNYSVSRSIKCVAFGIEERIDEEFVGNLINEMKKIIKADYPIVRKRMTINEAMKLYQEKNYTEKLEILPYRKEDTVNSYYCNGYINYMFGYMVPSTGYLTEFSLRTYYPGFILQYPRADADGKIPPFEDAPRFNTTLFEAEEWTKICGGGYIPDINKHVSDGTAIDFINMCETRHNNMLAKLGEKIENNRRNIRLIAIAGPSSSGKTTFSMRLKIELMTRKLKPVMISIDDYYLRNDAVPKDENGDPDFEHINALDVELFNHDMLALIQGKEVTLPKFCFKTGKRVVGETVRVEENQPIIIEGIHALNETLTYLIPRHQKFKIYIGPLVQMHIDNLNPINITDVRLLRRMVRDYKYRNTEAKRTFDMWPSVRRGEFRWIYPNQEDADFIFNSELAYELCVMKKYALPMLENISREDPYFVQANRLVKFLKYFLDIDDEWVPCNSLLREFIGGSCFHV